MSKKNYRVAVCVTGIVVVEAEDQDVAAEIAATAVPEINHAVIFDRKTQAWTLGIVENISFSPHDSDTKNTALN